MQPDAPDGVGEQRLKRLLQILGFGNDLRGREAVVEDLAVVAEEGVGR
jgi:hypothetical protein